MRRLGLVAVLPILAYAGIAGAQPAPPPPGPDRSNSHFDLHQNKAGDAAAASARGRVAAGDCKGALGDFDEALKTSQDPELRRERGLCHEKLGNKYPALEDLRAYLAAKPDAADAEQLRARVQKLESELDNGKPIRNVAKKSGANESDAEVFAANRGEEDRKKAELIGPKPGEQEKDYNYYKKQEELADEAKESAVRYGTGLVVGGFLGIPRYFIIDGKASDLSFLVGGRAGYSTGKYITLYAEVGYAGLTSSEGEARDRNRNSNTGPMIGIGAEARLPITRRASDQILLRVGADYEHLINEGNRRITHLVPGRAAVGYRHVFGPSVGVEVLADGGPGVSIDEHSNSQFFVAIAGNVGVVVGF
jgi:tetratricopeptide (TPR) repeat protein